MQASSFPGGATFSRGGKKRSGASGPISGELENMWALALLLASRGGIHPAKFNYGRRSKGGVLKQIETTRKMRRMM